MAEPSFAAGLVGAVLDGRYRLDALLGEGGMGAVFRATHLAMERRVAIKLLKPHLIGEPAARARFEREARATMRVASPHAVKVLDFGITPDDDARSAATPYIALEYLDGRTVQRELDVDGPFAPARVVHIARQALHALGAAHAEGLVHRDIKPENLLLVRVGEDPDVTKVVDFGVAKLMEGAARSAKSAMALTQAGMVFGTPEFMSPEQACGQPLDGRSDLYALAATMFAMLTGCGLFVGATAIEWLTHHVRTPAPHLAEGRAELAVYPELDAVLQRCLAKAPGERPASAGEMEEMLAGVERTLTRAPAAGLGEPGVERRMRGASASPSSYIAAVPAEPAVPAAPAYAPTMRAEELGPVLRASQPTTTTGMLAAARGRRVGWIVMGGVGVGVVVVGIAVVAILMAMRGPHGAVRVAAATGVETPGARGETQTQTQTQPQPEPQPQPVSGPQAEAGSGAEGSGAEGGAGSGAEGGAGSGAEGGAGSGAETGSGAEGGKRVRRVHRESKGRAEAEAHVVAAERAKAAGNRLHQLAEADAALRIEPGNVRARLLAADALLADKDLENGCKYLRMISHNATARARAHQAGCPGD